MKIVYVENARIPSERAHAYQTVQWCHWMGKMGHDITLVTPDRAGGMDVHEYYQLSTKTFTHVILPTWDALTYKWLPQRVSYVFQRLTFLRSLKTWAKGQSADVWYTRSTVMIRALHRLVRGAWALEVHDDPTTNAERWRRVQGIITLYIAISEGLKSKLERSGVKTDHILVAHDGVDIEAVDNAFSMGWRERLSIPKDDGLFVYTGSLYPWKGVDMVVKHWVKMPADAHLVIVGGGKEDQKRLRGLASTAAPHIHFLSHLPRNDVFSLLKEADVGVLPTSDVYTIGREYTSPLKMFEYLAAGIPILARDVPSSREILTGQVARFFKDESSLKDAVVWIMEHEPWRADAAKLARSLASRYTWEARARAIATALQHSLSSS